MPCEGTTHAHTPQKQEPARPTTEPRTIDSESLFEGARELRISHGDASYRLTITRLNKLILTK